MKGCEDEYRCAEHEYEYELGGREGGLRLGGCTRDPGLRLGRSRALPVGRGLGVAGGSDQLQHDLMDRFDRFHAD